MSFLGQMFGTNAQYNGPQVSQGQFDAATGRVNTAFDQQQAFVNAMQAQGGLANQSNVFQQQQQLANQLQQQAMGQGPNPAQAQLAQNTAANVAQQSALMAGQRGGSANAGLMARQAAQQGGAMQQQATGQAATMQANQQLAAQQQLQQQQAMMGGLAGQQVGQMQQGIGQMGQMALGGQQNLTSQSGVQAQVANANAQRNSQLVGGLLGGAGAALTGGLLGAAAPVAGAAAAGGGGSPQYMMNGFAHGGMVDKVQAKTTEASRRDMGFGKVILKNDGGMVPGQAPVAGDHPKNDIVPAALSPGELIIPRTVVQAGPEAIMKFVNQVLEEDND